MKKLMVIMWLLPLSVSAHHSKDHMMLAEDTKQVIADTQQGAAGGELWLLWVGVAIFLLLGLVRWWRGRS